jgi:hypothetical protein
MRLMLIRDILKKLFFKVNHVLKTLNLSVTGIVLIYPASHFTRHLPMTINILRNHKHTCVQDQAIFAFNHQLTKSQILNFLFLEQIQITIITIYSRLIVPSSFKASNLRMDILSRRR